MISDPARKLPILLSSKVIAVNIFVRSKSTIELSKKLFWGQSQVV